jgi:transposase
MRAAGNMSDRAIARALGVGRRTVAKYRDGAATPAPAARDRPAPVREAVEGELKRMLEANALLPRKQRLSARGMWEALMDSGIAASEGHIRKIVGELRGTGGAEFVPLLHEPGASAQFDWFDAAAYVAGVKTPVSVFVAALPCSGAVCAFAYPNKKMASFIHGHVQVFSWMSGVVRQATYDNLKTAVLSGSGKNAVTQDEFKRLEAHYGFKAVFCNAEAGWEKGQTKSPGFLNPQDLLAQA